MFSSLPVTPIPGEPLRKLRRVNTDEVVKARMAETGELWGVAIEAFRTEFYAGTIHHITNPEVAYDAKADRYTLKYEINGKKHSLKCTNTVAQFVAEASTAKQAMYGFIMESGVVVDAVSEVWG